MGMKLSELSDSQLSKLVDNRWHSSDTVWDTVKKTYDQNIKYYKNEPEWLERLPKNHPKVRDSRIFPNMESVINSLIANPPRPIIISGRDTDTAKELATTQERYFSQKYDDLNVKETLRKGLRNLYLARLIVLKPFWDSSINDFNVRAVDPRKIRVGKNATKEDDSEFAIEEVSDSLSAVLKRFPEKKEEILKKQGIKDEAAILINNPEVKYKEAWIRDMLICKMGNIILSKGRNHDRDWETLQHSRE